MAALLIAQVPAGPISRELVSLIIGYVVLGVVVSAFYYLSRNAWLKRKLLAPFNIVIGVYFGCILYVGGAPPLVCYLFFPMLIVFTILNFRSTRFCDACGRTLYRQHILTPAAFCSHCGAELQ